MRTRDLKPAFFRDLELTQLPAITRILYQGLWCRADKRGRQEDIVALIKADIFPLENVPVEKHLKLLESGGFIERYQVEGKQYIWIPKFLRHQHPHPKEPDSVLPEAPGEAGLSNDPITAEPLPFPESPGNSGSDPSHTLSSNTLAPNTLATAPPAAMPASPLSTELQFSKGEWEQLHASFRGLNVTSLWREWVSWIEEERGGRWPRDKYEAFSGWLRNKQKKAARQTGEAKPVYAVN